MNTKAINGYWVVVADDLQAIVYARESRTGPMSEHARFRCEAARQSAGAQITDKGGRSFDSHGHGRHTMIRESGSPEVQAREGFAREIADYIAKAGHANEFGYYAIVAAPRFLGALRAALASRTKQQPYAVVDKAVVGRDPEFIAKLVDTA